jgi:predicted  nucleic acid-binding Zn-ribbon protein
MSRNQQIQNFIDALEQATGISVDADLTAESVTIEDSNGDELAITTAGGVTVTDDGNFEVADVLSNVTVTDDGNFEVDIISDTVTVEDAGTFEVADVLSTLTVTDDGTFDINSLPEPLDVSGATVTVTDDGTFAIDSVSAVVETTGPSTTANSGYGFRTVEDTATFVRDADANRESVLLQNRDGSDSMYVGFDDNLTPRRGVEVPPGGTYSSDKYTGALYAITDTGTLELAFQEIIAD